MKMIVIPQVPVITFLVNRFTKFKGGRYKVYNERYIIRHLIFNVWYTVAFMKNLDATALVNLANTF